MVAAAGQLRSSLRGPLGAVLNVGRKRDEGVAAVDNEERVESLNPAMARLLGTTPERAVGRRLSEIASELALSRVLETGQAELEQIDGTLDLESRLAEVVIVMQERLRRIFALFHALRLERKHSGTHEDFRARQHADNQRLNEAIAALLAP